MFVRIYYLNPLLNYPLHGGMGAVWRAARVSRMPGLWVLCNIKINSGYIRHAKYVNSNYCIHLVSQAHPNIVVNN